MSSTTFVNQQTVIQADWLNDVNSVTYNLIGNGTTIPATKPALLTSIGALGSANNLSDIGNAATARTNLGVTASGADTTYLFRANNLSDLANATTARTNLGLGSIATQAASNVAITGGSITGITDLSVADGGTGSSTLTANAVLLGNGTSALQTVAPGASGNVLKSNGTTWTSASSNGVATLVNNVTVGTGTSVTYSGLTLTDYKILIISFNGVSNNATTATGRLYLASGSLGQIAANLGTATDVVYGSVYIDLSTGNYWANTGSISTTSPTAGVSSNTFIGICAYTTSSTSISLYTGGASFDAGSVYIYGVK